MVPDADAWRAISAPPLRALGALFDETVALVLPEGVAVRVVAAVEPTRPLRVGVRVGSRLPAHRCAGGLALLTALPDAGVRALYALPRPEWHEDPPPAAELADSLDAARAVETGLAGPVAAVG